MTTPVRIPADVDMADRVLGPLTGRQLAILAATGGVLYLLWSATRTLVPLPVFGVLAVPVAVTATVLALGQRDGVSMDKLMLAAIRQRLAPRHHVAAPEGVHEAPAWLIPNATTDPTGTTPRRRGTRTNRRAAQAAPLRLPAEAVTDAGVIDLGGDGLAVVATASTVNFALRTPDEQEGLVAIFGRYLHSLGAPLQVLVRTERLDLASQIAALREDAGGLPHPALEAAALEHADYLDQLAHQTNLLRRQVLLVLREPLGPGAAAPSDGLGGPGPLAVLAGIAGARGRKAARRGDTAARRAAQARLVRRLGEAVDLLTPAGISVTALDAGRATTVLAAACNPDTLLPASPRLAGADEVITTAGATTPSRTSRTSGRAPDDDGSGSFFARARTTGRRRAGRDTEKDTWDEDAWDDQAWDDQTGGSDDDFERGRS